MNIFKSKEIYKKTSRPGNDELRPVRGMWVSGEHLDPYCIDSTIHVVEMGSNNADVIEYKTSTGSIYQDPSIRILGYEETNEFEIENYYQSKDALPTDMVIRIKGLFSSDFNYVYYTKIDKALIDPKPELRIKGLMETSEFIYKNLIDKIEQTTPEPTIHILEFGSSILKIS